MRTVMVPDVSDTSRLDDDVTHLVCSCQVGPDDRALRLPIAAYCGLSFDDPEPSWSGPPCSMCAEVYADLGCPVCRPRRGGR